MHDCKLRLNFISDIDVTLPVHRVLQCPDTCPSATCVPILIGVQLGAFCYKECVNIFLVHSKKMSHLYTFCNEFGCLQYVRETIRTSATHYYIVVELVRDVGVIKVQLCACKLIHVHVIGTCAISDTGSMSTICHILDCIQNSNSTSNQRDEIVAVARQKWELPLLINLK